MNLSAVEILAVILIVLSVAKLLFVVTNFKAWMQLMKWLFASPKFTALIASALAGVLLYFLVRSGLTIVQILAVCLFVSLLFIAGIAPYFSHISTWLEGKNTTQILKEQWLYAVIWFLLLGWGVYELAVK